MHVSVHVPLAYSIKEHAKSETVHQFRYGNSLNSLHQFRYGNSLDSHMQLSALCVSLQAHNSLHLVPLRMYQSCNTLVDRTQILCLGRELRSNSLIDEVVLIDGEVVACHKRLTLHFLLPHL